MFLKIAETLKDIEQQHQLQSQYPNSSITPDNVTTLPSLVELNTTVTKEENEPEIKPEIPIQIERQLSKAEIEARKEEAREIVINAIDAALARDLSRLMDEKLQLGESSTGLRKRTLVLGELDEDNESSTNVTQQRAAEGTGAQNLVLSLSLAAVMFIILKLLYYYYFSS